MQHSTVAQGIDPGARMTRLESQLPYLQAVSPCERHSGKDSVPQFPHL